MKLPQFLHTPTLPESSNVGIRYFTGYDLVSCLAIEQASFDPLPRGDGPGPWDMRRHLDRGSGTIVVVAVEGDRPVGYLAYTRWPGTLYLIEIAVDPARRRRAVGSRLVRWLRGRLWDNQYCIEAAVPLDAIDVLRFFQAQGFSAVPHLRGHYVGDGGVLRMVYEQASAIDSGCGEET